MGMGLSFSNTFFFQAKLCRVQSSNLGVSQSFVSELVKYS